MSSQFGAISMAECESITVSCCPNEVEVIQGVQREHSQNAAMCELFDLATMCSLADAVRVEFLGQSVDPLRLGSNFQNSSCYLMKSI